MLSLRIIPRLDVKGPNLVKGVHLEGLRVLGKPQHFAEHYYEAGADELLFVDVVASLYGRNNLLELIEKTAKKIFIPLTVAGGIRTVEDIRKVLRVGADKVAINTAAVGRPEFVREAARHFGSSTIVVAIEAMRQKHGGYEAFTDNGRERTGLDAIAWAKQVNTLGAGEILLTSIDQEGTGRGYDLELAAKVAAAVDIPVILCGGAGTLDHVVQAAKANCVQGLCLASLLHYHIVKHHPISKNQEYGLTVNTSVIDQQQGFARIQDIGLGHLKKSLKEAGVHCRV